MWPRSLRFGAAAPKRTGATAYVIVRKHERPDEKRRDRPIAAAASEAEAAAHARALDAALAEAKRRDRVETDATCADIELRKARWVVNGKRGPEPSVGLREWPDVVSALDPEARAWMSLSYVVEPVPVMGEKP